MEKLTPELRAMGKKLLDKNWRIDNLYTIVNKKGEKIRFKRNSAQLDFDKNKHNLNFLLKSRRLGFTTYEAIDSLDDVLFTENFNSLFLAHTLDDAIEIFDTKVDYAWKNFNKDLAQIWGVDASSARKLKFNFGDNTFSQIKVSNSGRSGTYNRIHSTEYAKLCAKYPAQSREFLAGTVSALTPGGRLDVESTAEGMDGNFYEIFIDAWNRKKQPSKSEWKAHFYNWQWEKEEMEDIKPLPLSEMIEEIKFTEYKKLHNLSDIEITYYYNKWLSLNKDWDLLHQEYPTTAEEAFVASGNTFFNKEQIIRQMSTAPSPLKIEREELPKKLYNHYINKDLIIYEKPQDLINYVIGADVAEGKNNDSSCASGINNKTLHPAFGFNSNKIRPDDFAEFLNDVGRYYNEAYLAVESNTGLWVLTELNEKHKYPNLYWRERIDDVTHSVSKQLGYHTGTGSQGRKVMLDNLLVAVNNNAGVWTKPFLDECLVFIRNEQGRPEAAQGKHDDEVISTGICHFIRENVPAEIVSSTNTVPKSLEEKIMLRLDKKKIGNNKGINQSNYY